MGQMAANGQLVNASLTGGGRQAKLQAEGNFNYLHEFLKKQ
jgi:hypothetical protein